MVVLDRYLRPVQLDISSNKELALNEKKIKAKYGVTINTIISSPIYPVNYNTFELFIDELDVVATLITLLNNCVSKLIKKLELKTGDIDV